MRRKKKLYYICDLLTYTEIQTLYLASSNNRYTVQWFVCLFKGLPISGRWLSFLGGSRIKVLRCKGTQHAADLFSLSRSAVPAAIFFTDPDWAWPCLKLIKQCTTRRVEIFLKENFAFIFIVTETAPLFRVTLHNNKWGSALGNVRLSYRQIFLTFGIRLKSFCTFNFQSEVK